MEIVGPLWAIGAKFLCVFKSLRRWPKPRYMITKCSKDWWNEMRSEQFAKVLMWFICDDKRPVNAVYEWAKFNKKS